MKKLMVALAMTLFMFIAIGISNVLAKTPLKEGNPGLPGCLAEVNQLGQVVTDQQSTILGLQDQIKELEELLDAMKNYVSMFQTGQTVSYYPGDDGYYKKGVAWPVPRFTNNDDGTVTDNLTGLIWLKDASCKSFFSGDNTGANDRNWSMAVTAANSLASGHCGLSDGSAAGDWRLPNAFELVSLIHWGFWNPALPNTAGTGQITQGDPFLNVVTAGQCFYFTSTTYLFHNDPQTGEAWTVPMSSGGIVDKLKAESYYVWPVRNAK
jgi:hypothetical protein